MRRIQPRQCRHPLDLGAPVARQFPRPDLESSQPLLGQRFQRLVDDQVHQFLRRVEAAAVLAGVGVGTNLNAAVPGAGGFPFEQALVDRSQLLHRHVAIVHEAAVPAFRYPRAGVAEVIHDRRDHRVRQPDALQHRRRLGCEQAAVVGRKSYRLVAPVDLVEQLGQAVVVVRRRRGERVLVGHAARHVLAHPLAQAVIVVARVVDRQQPTILGVKDEQHTVQEDERRRTGFGQVLVPGGVGDRSRQAGEDPFEHYAREILRDRLLVPPSFGEGGFEVGRARRPLPGKGVAPEQQEKDPQTLIVARLEQVGEVRLEEAARPRPRPPVIQPPHGAVGEDAEPDAPFRGDVGGSQVAQHLAVRGAGTMPVGPVALIEREPEPLALLHDQGIPKTLVRIAPSGSARLGRRVGEQQMVGDILVTGGRLLRQVVTPAEQFQDRPNQILLGHRFVRLSARLEPSVCGGQFTPKNGELRRGRGGPLRSRPDAVGKKELSE